MHYVNNKLFPVEKIPAEILDQNNSWLSLSGIDIVPFFLCRQCYCHTFSSISLTVAGNRAPRGQALKLRVSKAASVNSHLPSKVRLLDNPAMDRWIGR